MANKCEACGLVSDTAEYVTVRTLNGGLNLCRPCLAEINGRNPEVKALRAECDRLRAELAAEKSDAERTFEEAAAVMHEADRVRTEIDALRAARDRLRSACKALLEHGTGGEYPPERVDAWDKAVADAETALADPAPPGRQT